MEERVERLEERATQQEAASLTLLGIVKETDRKVDELTGAVRSIQVHEAIVDARLNTVDARLASIKHEMDLSFQQVAQAQLQMEDRLNKRIDGLGDQLAQVIALLTRKEE